MIIGFFIIFFCLYLERFLPDKMRKLDYFVTKKYINIGKCISVGPCRITEKVIAIKVDLRLAILKGKE